MGLYACQLISGTNSAVSDSSPQILSNSSASAMDLNFKNPIKPSSLIPLAVTLSVLILSAVGLIPLVTDYESWCL